MVSRMKASFGVLGFFIFNSLAFGAPAEVLAPLSDPVFEVRIDSYVDKLKPMDGALLTCPVFDTVKGRFFEFAHAKVASRDYYIVHGWVELEDSTASSPSYEQLVSGWVFSVGLDDCKVADSGYALDWSSPSPARERMAITKDVGSLLAKDYVARMVVLFGSQEKLVQARDNTGFSRAWLPDLVQLEIFGKVTSSQ